MLAQGRLAWNVVVAGEQTGMYSAAASLPRVLISLSVLCIVEWFWNCSKMQAAVKSAADPNEEESEISAHRHKKGTNHSVPTSAAR